MIPFGSPSVFLWKSKETKNTDLPPNRCHLSHKPKPGGGGASHQRTEHRKVALAPSEGSSGGKEETRVSWRLGAETLHLTPFSLSGGTGTTLRICICQPHAALACQVSPQQEPEVTSWLLGTRELPRHKAWSLLFQSLCGALVSGECDQGAQKGGALRSSESLTPSRPASALLEA